MKDLYAARQLFLVVKQVFGQKLIFVFCIYGCKIQCGDRRKIILNLTCSHVSTASYLMVSLPLITFGTDFYNYIQIFNIRYR